MLNLDHLCSTKVSREDRNHIFSVFNFLESVTSDGLSDDDESLVFDNLDDVDLVDGETPEPPPGLATNSIFSVSFL